MRLSRKGDLALSTNAIVVLIVAVIILGLIITFITQGFGAVSDRFFGEIENMPNPTTPSASNPITTSDVLVKGRGEDFGFKVSIFNPTAGALTLAPALDCTAAVLNGNIQANARSVGPRAYETFTVVGKVADAAPEGKNLCSLTAVDGTTVVPQISATDVIIQVSK
jgi:hypothetical protein